MQAISETASSASDSDDGYVYASRSHGNKKARATITVHEPPSQVLVDSGSSVSILNFTYNTYSAIFRRAHHPSR